MIQIIPKGFRYPFPWFGIFKPILLGKKDYVVKREIEFTSSAMYYFADHDQFDVNKLFGFSVGWHHNTSFRFGWRPNTDLTKVEIVVYEYANGIRLTTRPICEVACDKTYRYTLKYSAITQSIMYLVSGPGVFVSRYTKCDLGNKNKIGYTLGLYFGGNKTAPHDITIYNKVVD